MSSGAINYGENHIKAQDGTPLFYRYWRSQQPKAVIVGVHGYAEYSARYVHVGEFFANNDYCFYIMDLRGHGKSGGIKGYVNKFDEFIKDLDLFIDHVHEKENVDKVFLLGHSMGGLIAVIYAIKHPEKLYGAITTGAALKLGEKISALKESFLRLLAKIRPKFRPNIPINKDLLTRDPEVNQNYWDDPLVFKKGTIRLLVEMVNSMKWAMANAQKLTVPIFMLHGSEDKIVPPSASEEFISNVASSDKRFELIEGSYHEIMNDLDKEKVLNMILKWLNEHVK